jgi:signal transduction histidine kinase
MMKRSVLLVSFILCLAHLLIIKDVNASTSEFSKDTTRVSELYQIAKTIVYPNPDSALLYLDTLEDISRKSDYYSGLYKAYNLRGIIEWVKNNPEQGIKYTDTALQYARKLDDPKLTAYGWANIGLYYSRLNNFDSSVFYFTKAIAWCDSNNLVAFGTKCRADLGNIYVNIDQYTDGAKLLLEARDEAVKQKDTTRIGMIYISLGNLFTKINRFELAKNYFKKAIYYSQFSHERNNLSLIYLNLGDLYFKIGDKPDSSYYYTMKGIEAALPYEKEHARFVANVNLGNLMMDKHQYDSVEYYFDQALSNRDIENNPLVKTAVTINMGRYYLYTNHLKKARSYLNSGLGMADSLNFMVYKKNALINLVRLDSLEGNYHQALINYALFHQVSDTVAAVEANYKIAVLDIEKTLALEKLGNQFLENQNDLNKNTISTQRRLINWIVLGVIVQLIVLFFLYVQHKRVRILNKHLSESQRELLEANRQLQHNNEILGQQKEELTVLHQTKDKFFSIIGHDLKSPFNSLIGLLDLLDQQWDSIEEHEKRDHIKALLKSSLSTHELLEELLLWGKTQEGLVKYMPARFNALEAVNKVAELLNSQISTKKISLKLELTPELELFTDKRLFAQIIQNLINNAVKFSHSGGIIHVFSKVRENNLLISVKDNGIGIPLVYLHKLFDLEHNFNRPGTNNEKSTGMGLLLSNEYAKIMHAQILVESEEGKGSTFTLKLNNDTFQ